MPPFAALTLALIAPDVPTREQLRPLAGTWQVVSVAPGGSERLEVCYRVEPVLGGRFLAGHATAAAPDFGSRDMWGLDEASGEVIRSIFDISGTHAVVRSKGWQGGTLVLEGDARSKNGSLRVRETNKRVSDSEFTATWEAWRGGKWQAYALETARRVNVPDCPRG